MNENKTLKEQTIFGVIWKFSERLIAQLVSFVVSIVLARMLLPEAYGLVALVMVFITICDKIVISGFATSLIQKKDADELDFSTVFYFSLSVSVVLYAALVLAAPTVAAFFEKYDEELLTAVLRIMGLRIIVAAANSVQHAYVSRTMQFKRFFWSTLGGTLISAVVGIWMAYAGFGVWALVAQYLTNSAVDTVVLWFTVRWRPLKKFSLSRLKTLYSFGWKIFAASLLKTIYNDLRSLVIGKVYTASDLAFYNKGNSFPQLIDSNVAGTIDSVLFPAIAKKQASKDTVRNMLRRTIKVSSYVLTPLLFGLAAVAEPLVNLLLTETWAPCIPYLQILSISFVFVPIEIENLQVIKAIGRSDIVLKLEIIKKTVGLILTVLAIPHGVLSIAISAVASAFFSAIMNAIPNRGLIGYSVKMQLADVLPATILSLAMFVAVYPISWMGVTYPVMIVLQFFLGAILYVVLSAVFKVESFYYIFRSAKGIIVTRKRGRE